MDRYEGKMASPLHKVKIGCYEPILLGRITLAEARKIALDNQLCVYLFLRNGKMKHLFTREGEQQTF